MTHITVQKLQKVLYRQFQKVIKRQPNDDKTVAIVFYENIRSDMFAGIPSWDL